MLTELKEFAPEIIRRMNLPEDRAKDLRRRVRATELAAKWASEFFHRMMEEAQIDEDEVWDECAQLFGFKNLADLEEQRYAMVLYGNQLQLRGSKDLAAADPTHVLFNFFIPAAIASIDCAMISAGTSGTSGCCLILTMLTVLLQDGIHSVRCSLVSLD